MLGPQRGPDSLVMMLYGNVTQSVCLTCTKPWAPFQGHIDWVRWSTPVIPALGNGGRGHQKIKAILGCTAVSSQPRTVETLVGFVFKHCECER